MKKWWQIAALAVILLLCSACGAEAPAAPENPEPPIAEETLPEQEAVQQVYLLNGGCYHIPVVRLAGVIDNLVMENIEALEDSDSQNEILLIPHGKELVKTKAGTQRILDQR